MSRQRGFTLLEIVIALLVLGLVAAAALRAAGGAIDATFYLRQQTFAHWVAMNQAAELTLAGEKWESRERSGSALLAGERWPWSFEVHETEEEEIARLEIEVWHDRQEGEPLTLLTVFRRRP
ncbi:MAG: type II secretion system minor pseudopilin GspI [Desulfurivibrio sp.]|nr:type II secretion system minor pseudopilin GspI [Desulfurivibrio sp.]